MPEFVGNSLVNQFVSGAIEAFFPKENVRKMEENRNSDYVGFKIFFHTRGTFLRGPLEVTVYLEDDSVTPKSLRFFREVRGKKEMVSIPYKMIDFDLDSMQE